MINLTQGDGLESTLSQKGYAVIPGMMDEAFCQSMINHYPESFHFRKTIQMARYRFGAGEYKYFSYPLPKAITFLRQRLYQHLAPLANRWMLQLGKETRYPADHSEFIRHCHGHGQERPTPLLLKYGKGDFNTLHQDMYGEVFFPLQAVVMLSDANAYEGGELVLTEQVPRAQSKATVLRPGQGDAVIFSTQFRPQKGARGYYRINMKHGVSEVTAGDRYTLGIIFHDAI